MQLLPPTSIPILLMALGNMMEVVRLTVQRDAVVKWCACQIFILFDGHSQTDVQNLNEYLRVWMAKHRREFLEVLYSLESRDENLMCSCGAPGQWHCLECIGSPTFCSGCCEEFHR